MYRKQVEKSIVWVNAVGKHRYEQQYIDINLPVGSKKIVKLKHGYIIPGISNKK